ncbi:FAD/NAD(P)-binding protein [Aerococcus suis]|uniref:Uncharacterized NAD(P)/FAD-binding protein YdhS n=1 Tax=Aerococcus suis TaxID=371602 RepID=A0A1W1Y4J5_9LACT|nr:FAD/NAD(P)-binding protein [Aerococcus suis]SMC30751.1 Uncharacterized NAD(P)/FAD-binding protein YdhS [Aerococcus suis]
MRIAIVGLGLTGSGALHRLLEANHDSPLQIDIFESKRHLAHGFPYTPDAHEILMNSSPQDLSINPENPNEFIEWVETHHPDIAKTHRFMPRPIYGEYLTAKISPDLDANNVQVIHKQVVRVLPKQYESNIPASYPANAPFQYQIVTDDDNKYGKYDAVILAIGHPPYADHYNLLGNKGYIHNPYPVLDKLTDLDQSKKVGIIGSGLSSIDVMRFLQLHYPNDWQQPITFYIRNLPFTVVRKPNFNRESPFSLSTEWIANEKQHHNGYLPLDHLIKQIQDDFKAGDIDWHKMLDQYGKGTVEEIRYEVSHDDMMLERLQGYIDRMKPLLAEINVSLSRQDKERLQRDYLDDFEHFRNQLAEPAMKDILSWLDEGKATIVSGLTDISATESGFDLTVNGETEHVDILINTAGFEKHPKKALAQNPLIANLYNDNLITLDDGDRFIQVTWPTSQLFNQYYGVFDHLYLLGYWIFNTQFGNNNAGISYRSGQKVAQHILDTLVQ